MQMIYTRTILALYNLMLNSTHKTLLEQMKISDAEIHHRLELVEFQSADALALSSAAPLIEINIELLVDDFYQNQVENSAIARLIGDSDTLARLKNAQHKYIRDLFSGNYNSAYVNNRLRIGLVHKRIGVEPKLYLSAVRTLEHLLVSLIRDNSEDLDADAVIAALDKLLNFDTTLVVDTYIFSMIAEIEEANRKIREYADSLEEKVAERTLELEALANRDPLTNLLNQRSMYDLAKRTLATARRRKASLTIAYFDVDNFKQINDQLGHLKGDDVLRSIGKATFDSVRETDIACRYGGDEFCIIFPDADANQAARICRRIIELFNESWPDFTLSIGVHQLAPGDVNTSIEDLINQADTRMYQAKKVEGSHIEL
jgi:diguanylate cyclase